MTFKVGKGNNHIGVHNRAADFRLFDIFSARYRHANLVRSLKPVGDYHLTTGAKGVVAIFISGVQMLKRVFAPSHIESVAVCEEGASAKTFHLIRHNFGIVGAQICQISRLSQMQLNRRILFFKSDILNSRLLYQQF